MLLRQLGRVYLMVNYLKINRQLLNIRQISNTSLMKCNETGSPETKKEITVRKGFEDLENKTKDTYLEMIKIFIDRDHVYRRGHVEFIYSALKNMENFGVQKDLTVYKALIDVLPKGRFIARNMMQVEFMHYPKQQQCMIDLLEQMEDNGVMPDYEIEDMLTNIFGRKAYPLRKFWRMMYWMPKFKNLSPWALPDPLPDDVFELAKLAIQRITSVDIQTDIKIYQSKDIEDAIDDTWIVSGQSPVQRRLLDEHNTAEPIYVEGSFKVWLKKLPVNYFILRTKPKPLECKVEDTDDVSDIKVSFFNFKPPVKKHLVVMPSVHEQEDGVILGVCATGTSSKDSLLSWIRHLEKDGNPSLARKHIVFTLRQPERELIAIEEGNKTEKEVV